MLAAFRWAKKVGGNRRKVYLEPTSSLDGDTKNQPQSDSPAPMQTRSKSVVSAASASKSRETSYVVSTFKNETPKHDLDTRRMSLTDLASLKKKDPFMYYSIPAVRDAALDGDDLIQLVEVIPVLDDAHCIVTRQTRISFERHVIASGTDIPSTASTDDLSHASIETRIMDAMSDKLSYAELDEESDDDWIFSFYEGN